MSKQLEWKTEQRMVKDLVPNEINPRKISEAKKAELIKYLQKYNVVEIPVINKDGKLITWNQRLAVMMLVGRGEEIVDVRVPNRKLTDEEVKEYTLIGNVHAGEWDEELLQLYFADIDFASLGIDIKSSNQSEPDAKEYVPETNWFINIKCNSEEQAQELYERFLAEGLDVKVVN